MKLLVHACCGPCSIMPTRLLREQGHSITAFYANSNIAPQDEYEKRLHELQKYANGQGFEVLEGRYDPAEWERVVAPIGEAIKDFSPAMRFFDEKEKGQAVSESPDRLSKQEALEGQSDQTACRSQQESAGQKAEGNQPVQTACAPQTVAELLDDERRKERCRACYRLRLEEAAAVAAEGGYDGLATTLAVSPYQFTDVIREELQRACSQVGIAAHFQDYRPYYDEATRISREMGMYRQNYCGCRFSVKEGQATRAFIKQQRAQAKAAKAQAQAAERAANEKARQSRNAEKQAYAEERARRHALLKKLRNQNNE